MFNKGHLYNIRIKECEKKIITCSRRCSYIRHRFHEVRALRALMHAARALRENDYDLI